MILVKMDGYLEEKGIPEDSDTETYLETSIKVENQRWNNVPIRVKAGKRLTEKKTEIRITFKPTFEYFLNIDDNCKPEPNILVIRIQPNEEVYYTLNAKFPGKGMCIHPVKLHFSYLESFDVKIKDAYTRLILDIIEGDQTLFIRSDETEKAWEYVMPLIKAKNDKKLKVVKYTAGHDFAEK